MKMLFPKNKLSENGVFSAGIAIILVAGSIVSLILLNNSVKDEVEYEVPNSSELTPTARVEQDNQVTLEPLLFREMTIPYLREREYSSRLTEFDKAYEHEEFSAYTTSYDSDGLQINGLLTIPKGDIPDEGWPAVVFVHGYIPPEQYRTLEKYEDYVNYLSRRGLVVFKIDLRGHGNSEGVPYGAYYAGEYVIDTLNAHSALKNTDYVDPSRIGLWGHSMAGNIVFRSFIASLEVKKVVIWAGAVYTYEDFQDYGISDNSYRPPIEDSERQKRREELFNTHGEFSPVHSFWRQIVPTNYLDGKSGKVQIHHAINDNVVDIRYSRNLVQNLKNTQVEPQLFEYISGGHNITGASFVQAIQRTADFYLE